MIHRLVAFPGFLIISSVPGVVNIMSLVAPAAPSLHSLCSMEGITIAQLAQWSPDCYMWNHSITVCTGRYRHQSFWYWRLLSSSAEVSGYLKYELHTKGTVLCFWSSLRCIKIWIVIYYRGLKFPQTAVVLLPLDSVAACTILNFHSARKSTVLL